MTRSDFVRYYADKLQIPEKDAERIISTIISTIKKALKSNERIEIRGFGAFFNKYYPGYTGSDPRTKKQITVAPKYAPVFKVSKLWLQELNRK